MVQQGKGEKQDQVRDDAKKQETPHPGLRNQPRDERRHHQHRQGRRRGQQPVEGAIHPAGFEDQRDQRQAEAGGDGIDGHAGDSGEQAAPSRLVVHPPVDGNIVHG